MFQFHVKSAHRAEVPPYDEPHTHRDDDSRPLGNGIEVVGGDHVHGFGAQDLEPRVGGGGGQVAARDGVKVAAGHHHEGGDAEEHHRREAGDGHVQQVGHLKAHCEEGSGMHAQGSSYRHHTHQKLRVMSASVAQRVLWPPGRWHQTRSYQTTGATDWY